MRATLFGLVFSLGVTLSLTAGGALADDDPEPCEEASDPDWRSPSDHGPDFSFGLDLFSIDHEPSERRVEVLDLLFFHGFRMRSRPDYEHVEVIDAPLVSLFWSRTEGAERSVRFIDLPLVEVFSYDRDSRSTDTQVLDLPLLGSLYRNRVDEKERRVDLLYLIRLRTPVEPTASGLPVIP
jgi:hypothetical protein